MHSNGEQLPKKYTHAWSEMKRKTCKLCQRTAFWCKRHSPRVTMETHHWVSHSHLIEEVSKMRKDLNEIEDEDDDNLTAKLFMAQGYNWALKDVISLLKRKV